MAIPKGKRTSRKKQEEAPALNATRITCKVTGKKFLGYEDQLPISKEGWTQLTDEQKFLLNKGVPLKEVL